MFSSQTVLERRQGKWNPGGQKHKHHHSPLLSRQNQESLKERPIAGLAAQKPGPHLSPLSAGLRAQATNPLPTSASDRPSELGISSKAPEAHNQGGLDQPVGSGMEVRLPPALGHHTPEAVAPTNDGDAMRTLETTGHVMRSGCPGLWTHGDMGAAL